MVSDDSDSEFPVLVVVRHEKGVLSWQVRDGFVHLLFLLCWGGFEERFHLVNLVKFGLRVDYMSKDDIPKVFSAWTLKVFKKLFYLESFSKDV